MNVDDALVCARHVHTSQDDIQCDIQHGMQYDTQHDIYIVQCDYVVMNVNQEINVCKYTFRIQVDVKATFIFYICVYVFLNMSLNIRVYDELETR